MDSSAHASHSSFFSWLLLFWAVTSLSGCLPGFTDPATRLASDIRSAARRVGWNSGSSYTLLHRTPSRRGECEGPYKAQLDRVGAIILWCYDAQKRATISSHSTTSHGSSVDTLRTFIVEKQAREPLEIRFERRGGRVVIVDVR